MDGTGRGLGVQGLLLVTRWVTGLAFSVMVSTWRELLPYISAPPEPPQYCNLLCSYNSVCFAFLLPLAIIP
ncbi:hypothetical protein XENTR_v10020289 [Xenopus tropicalis]|nr:hypothetical protein XENTR_v10020227 [Xenopus tropicalis]KAE8582796.1 hypothetical protein XENTR_v10020282 [Xenopus tropicalis]KAE8582803.1 hypothetical protein XENTR_v10020289 [Xenopus tropicalis]